MLLAIWGDYSDVYAFLIAYLVIFIIIALVAILLIAFIGSLLTALFYLLSLNWIAKDADRRTYGECYVTSLISTFAGLVPCAGLFLMWLVINKRHNISYGKAILVWLIAALLSSVISSIISFVVVIAFGGMEAFLNTIMTFIESIGGEGGSFLP